MKKSVKGLQHLKRGNMTIEEVLNKYGFEIAKEYQRRLKESFASGNLHNSVYFDVKEENDGTNLYIIADDYWKYVEYGRPPGKQPPPDKVLQWIKDKPILPQPYTLPSGKSVLPTDKQLAFLIGRKIGKEGIKGKPYLQESRDDQFIELFRELREAVKEDYEVRTGIIFNELRQIK